MSLKGYDRYSAKFFNLEDDPKVQDWDSLLIGDDVKVRSYYHCNKGLRVKMYELKEIPWRLKRNQHDSAKLLILYLEDGSAVCKRHNNSQLITIGE